MLTLSTRHAILHLEHLRNAEQRNAEQKYWDNTVLCSLPAAVLPEYTQTFIYSLINAHKVKCIHVRTHTGIY